MRRVVYDAVTPAFGKACASVEALITKIVLIPTITLAIVMIAAAPPPPSLRAVEPRLSGNWQWRRCSRKKVTAPHVVEEADCGIPNIPRHLVSIPPGECDDVTQTQSEAVEALAAARPCTEAAVATLKKLADRPQPSASVVSDLAAAYFVRAQRKDQPSDFVRALDAADRAARLAPRAPEPRFNQALALEALGFDDDAIASWDDLRRSDRGPWANEAAAHWNRLVKERARRIATQWPLNVQRLPDAARAGDRAAIAQLIAPYPAAALHHLENKVLPAWAQALSAGDERESRRQLRLAHMIATELARLSGDRYALDGVEQIESTKSKRRLAALQKGVLAFSAANERRSGSTVAAQPYRDAEAAFSAAGSPFRAAATIGRAVAVPLEPGNVDRLVALLAPVEREARRKRYRYLLARVHMTRGFFLVRRSRYLDSLSEYDAAEAIFARMQDQENLGNIHARKLGILRIIGDKDLTWREALQARRYESRIVDLAQRHVLLGEIAHSAVALGYPQIALRYQNAAVRILQDQLARPGDDDSQVGPLRASLGVALYERAAIRGRLGDPLAMQDLHEATRLLSEGKLEENIRKSRLARIREIEGQLLLHSNPRLAAAAFTEAYALASPVYYRTYTASLLVARAEARLLNGERAAAEADLQNAIAELRREERGMLEGRERGRAEAVWAPYFSRSRDAYTRLIRQLVEEGKAAEAFGYAEQARAYDLLNLVLDRNRIPAAFHTWTKGEPLDLQRIRSVLPPATFIVEYSVLGDRTYAWLIGRDDFKLFELSPGDDQIAAWSADLAHHARQRREASFRATAAAVSAALLREPLMRIAQLERARKLHAKVIFIPDASMHGLPFPALADPADAKRYLIERYPVAVAPSATLYTFSLARNAQLAPAGKATVLLVGDPAFKRGLDVAFGLKRLAGARAEIDKIRDTYEPVAKVVSLPGALATVPAFLELAPRSSVVHFAGHAIANADAPWRSLLLFAPSSGQSGALDASELLTKLRSEQTRLVVLAACNATGGLTPLARPIIASGVPAAVGSLWNVGDVETKELFDHFHQHYREGHDADVALQLAQLDMLHHSTQLFHYAASWASFQVIGFASSPFSAEKRRK